jgi:hypothetical protein
MKRVMILTGGRFHKSGPLNNFCMNKLNWYMMLKDGI